MRISYPPSGFLHRIFALPASVENTLTEERTMEWTYERAGVSLQRSDAWIDLVRKIASRASSPNVLSGIGGFSGL
ncbi:MAG TPA: hypothetical protein DIT24_02935, partial [Synergistaceae bacterium]|nr:hypothetical protein [Synergistaceae bacterium]